VTKRSILLVEDNADDEELTIRALRKNGITSEVSVARDGVEALDYMFATGAWADRDTGAMPAVVLLDLKLPRLDGLEVLERMRQNERTRMIPVVILTSSREEQDLIRSYRLCANSYVCKPVDFKEFTETIRNLGVYWLVVNEVPPAGRPAGGI
jgi:CheY-like chemotaxis protein